jgi:hypothetical protein
LLPNFFVVGAPNAGTTANEPLRAGLRNVLPEWLWQGLRRAAHRRPPQITRLERARVLDIYEADIHELQRMLKLDLSAWLRR